MIKITKKTKKFNICDLICIIICIIFIVFFTNLENKNSELNKQKLEASLIERF
jgi:competence protein ComGC